MFYLIVLPIVVLLVITGVASQSENDLNNTRVDSINQFVNIIRVEDVDNKTRPLGDDLMELLAEFNEQYKANMSFLQGEVVEKLKSCTDGNVYCPAWAESGKASSVLQS